MNKSALMLVLSLAMVSCGDDEDTNGAAAATTGTGAATTTAGTGGSGGGTTTSSGTGGGGPSGPHLVPGDGFVGPTMEPAAGGDPQDSAFDATAIARWDVVPSQDVIGTFEVGVVAFDIRGIDRVEFSVEGGPWAPVSTMSKNPRTGVWEYWAVLDAVDFPAAKEGPIELRAIAYPKVGVPRVLADGASMQNDAGDGSLHLFVDKGVLSHASMWVATTGDDTAGDGSQAKPFATLQGAVDALTNAGTIGGATIYLGEGEYLTPDQGESTDDRWLTVTRDAQAARAAVKLVDSAGRWNTRHVRLHDLTVAPTAAAGGSIANPSTSGGAFWFDDIDIDGGDREIAAYPLINQADTYWTGVNIREYKNPVDTWNGTNLIVRGVHAQGVLEDTFRMSTLLLDSSVDDVDPRSTDAHPDIIQYGGADDPPSNFIVYGLEATNAHSQGIYINGYGWALVNIAFHAPGGGLWQIDEGIASHILLWHVTTVAQDLDWRTGNQTSMAANISIMNSTFESMNFGESSKGNPTDESFLQAQMEISDNNFANGMTLGTGATGVDPALVDPPSGNFRPAPGSPLRSRAKTLVVPADLAGVALATDGSAAIGALQPDP